LQDKSAEGEYLLRRGVGREAGALEGGVGRWHGNRQVLLELGRGGRGVLRGGCKWPLMSSTHSAPSDDGYMAVSESKGKSRVRRRRERCLWSMSDGPSNNGEQPIQLSTLEPALATVARRTPSRSARDSALTALDSSQLSSHRALTCPTTLRPTRAHGPFISLMVVTYG
jgi:hypothetical protein